MGKTMESSATIDAMDILRELRQITEEQDTPSAKLDKIVKMIVQQMQADAGMLFLLVDDNLLELFASCGYNEGINHKIKLHMGEGLVGLVAQNKHSIAIKNAWKHPNFFYDAEIGEDAYRSFIGVPLIRWKRAIGVLALERKKVYEHSVLETEILETVAMVLSEIAVSEEMTAYKESIQSEKERSGRERIKGISLNKGHGMGFAVIHRRHQAATKIFADDKGKELSRLEIAHSTMNADLDKKLNSARLGIGEHVDILDAYKMFAQDKGWYKKISDNIQSGLTAEAATERAYEDMWNRLSGTNDPYLKERLHDLRDITDRLIGYLNGDANPAEKFAGKDIVVVSLTMGPADLMDYDYSKIRGLIIEDGTPTMHVAIVAKALGIPVVAKTKGILNEIKTGDLLAVDGDEGYAFIRPSHPVQDKIKNKIAEKEKLRAKLAELRKLPAITQDGVKLNLALNVGLAFDLDYIETTNCNGIGLYRTEIPFMASDTMPDVERQIGYYKDLMNRAGHKKVIFRSLDVGSDKLLPYWTNSREDNPAIGWRSIRITLDRRAILRKQMKAFLRAAADKELNVMFPMVANLSEFEEAKETLMLELEKEKRRGAPVPKKVNAGMMIEVPSVLFQLENLLEKVDFISVGTNDLAQFVFASDRGNSRLAERYDVLSAPFLKVMSLIISQANNAGVYCSVCGEMASNPIEAMALIGLGYRNLSMSGSAFGRVKSMIRSLNVSEVEDYVKNLLKSTRRTLRPQLISYANDHGIEIY